MVEAGVSFYSSRRREPAIRMRPASITSTPTSDMPITLAPVLASVRWVSLAGALGVVVSGAGAVVFVSGAGVVVVAGAGAGDVVVAVVTLAVPELEPEPLKWEVSRAPPPARPKPMRTFFKVSSSRDEPDGSGVGSFEVVGFSVVVGFSDVVGFSEVSVSGTSFFVVVGTGSVDGSGIRFLVVVGTGSVLSLIHI